MTNDDVQKRLGKWLKTRPKKVQKLAAEFPAGMKLQIREQPYFVIGWAKNGVLVISKVDPAEDYDGAVASKEYAHADHFRA